MKNSGKNYVCSKCGQSGHNRRTCGKPVPAAAGKPTLPASAPSTVSQPAPTATITDAIRTLSSEPETVTVAEPVVETMTAEDIETWWILASGKTGKLEKVTLTNFAGWKSVATVAQWSPDDTTALLDMLDVAVKQNTTPRTLKKFLNFFGAAAKKSLAADKRTGPKILAILAKDSSAGVRQTVAENMHLPDSIAMMLAEDKNYNVRLSLTSNKVAVQSHVLEKIFREQDNYPPAHTPKSGYLRQDILFALAFNPNTPDNVHNELLASKNLLLVAEAVQNLRTTETQLEDVWNRHWENNESIRRNVLRHRNVEVKVVESFIDRMAEKSASPQGNFDDDGYSLYLTTADERISPEHLNTLSKILQARGSTMLHRNTLAMGIVKHPHTTDEALHRLIETEQGRVIAAARTELARRAAEKTAAPPR